MSEEMPVKREKKEVMKGLKRLRAGATGGKPENYCENCKCHRYSLCGCQKKAD